MKKLVIALVAIALVLPLFAVNSLAVTDAVVYRFDSQDAYDDWEMFNYSSSHDCEYSYEDGALKMVSLNGPEEGDDKVGDPYIMMSAEDENGKYFSADDYKWCKIRIKNTSEAIAFEMHFATDSQRLDACCCVHTDITPGSSEYVDYVFYVPDANVATFPLNDLQDTYTESVWAGTVQSLRLDIMWKAEKSGQMPTGSTAYLKWIAFFSSEEDAKAYDGEKVAAATTTAAPTDPATDAPTAPVTDASTANVTDAGTNVGTEASTNAGTQDVTTSGTSSGNNNTLYIILGCVAGAILIAIVVVAVVKSKKK